MGAFIDNEQQSVHIDPMRDAVLHSKPELLTVTLSPMNEDSQRTCITERLRRM